MDEDINMYNELRWEYQEELRHDLRIKRGDGYLNDYENEEEEEEDNED